MNKNKKGLLILSGFLTIFIIVSFGCNPSGKIKIIEKPIITFSDIMPITDSLVIPYVYTDVISLKALPVIEKKQKFFDMMLPAVLVAKQELDILQKKVDKLSLKAELTDEEQQFVDKLLKKYKAKNIHLLKSRLTTFPVSIVLAQAAIESAWGTSRFFLEADNPFGLWSFDPTEDRIAASSTRSGKKVYLKKFHNLEQSIDAYYTTLATGPFAEFRKHRLTSQDPYELVTYLIDYSERREDYVKEVVSVIRGNNLTKYDNYRIDPKYYE